MAFAAGFLGIFTARCESTAYECNTGLGRPTHSCVARQESSAVAEMGDRASGPKSGGLLWLFPWGNWVPSNTMWPGQGLSPYQMVSWSIQPFDHNRHGLKIGGCCAPFFGGAESPTNTLWPGPRPISVPSGILPNPSNRLHTIHQGYRQTDNGPIKTVCKTENRFTNSRPKSSSNAHVAYRKKRGLQSWWRVTIKWA